MNDKKIGPSRWFYGLGILVAVIGSVIFVVFLINSISGIADELTRVVVPGEKDIVLNTPGNYTIFYEYQSVMGNKVYSTGEYIPGLQCLVISKTTGKEIVLSPARTSSTYSIGSRAGKGVLEFTIDKPGTYEFSAWYAEPKAGPEIVMAIGSDFTLKLVSTIFVAIAIFFGSWIIAAIIAIITFIKRRRAKKSIEVSSAVQAN